MCLFLGGLKFHNAHIRQSVLPRISISCCLVSKCCCWHQCCSVLCSRLGCVVLCQWIWYDRCFWIFTSCRFVIKCSCVRGKSARVTEKLSDQLREPKLNASVLWFQFRGPGAVTVSEEPQLGPEALFKWLKESFKVSSLSAEYARLVCMWNFQFVFKGNCPSSEHMHI